MVSTSFFPSILPLPSLGFSSFLPRTIWTGFITLENLKKVAKEVGESQITEEELKDMIDEGDLDGDGKINLEEFTKIMQKVQQYYK